MGCCGGDKNAHNGYSGVSNDKPREHSSDFKGPVDKRGCTDVICCLFFVIFILAFSVIAIWAFAMGDIKRILYPTDSSGKICGYDYPEKKFLLFFDITRCLSVKAAMNTFCPTEKVCVPECPTEAWSYHTAQDTPEVRRKMICHEGKNANDKDFVGKSITALAEEELCAPYTMKSSPLFYRCVPQLMADAFHSGDFASTNATLHEASNTLQSIDGHTIDSGLLKNATFSFLKVISYVESAIHDIEHNWTKVLGCIGIAMLFCISYIALMRCCAKPMIWFTLVLFFILFAAVTMVSFIRYVHLKSLHTDAHYEFTLNVGAYFAVPTTWLVLGIVFGIILVIMLIVLVFLRKRIVMAVAIIEETSKGVASMLSTLFWPLIPHVMHVCVLVFCIFVLIQLRSVTNPNSSTWTGVETVGTKQKIQKLFQSLPCNATATGTGGKVCRFLGYGGKEFIVYLQVFTVFMMFWLLNFVSAFHEMTLAGAFANFYFNRGKVLCPVFKSAKNALCCHMGTLALGSLIVAIVQTIRAILNYVQLKLKDAENPVAKFFLKCLSCCFWCLEKFLRFINRNAYIMTAIYGQSFCQAAANAFSLLARNMVRVFVLDKIADLVFLLGRVIVIVLSVGVYFLLMQGHVSVSDNFLSLSVIILGSYLIGKVFFSVYSMGVDTIFLCVLEDLERNDGSREKPYLMSSSLKEAMEVQNQKPAPDHSPKKV